MGYQGMNHVRVFTAIGLMLLGGQPCLWAGSPEPLVSWLPVGAETMRASDSSVPLPFGFGVQLAYVDQEISFNDLQLGFGTSDITPSGVSLTDATAKDTAVTGQLEAWLLPFLKVYGTLGAVDNVSTMTANVPSQSFDISIDLGVPGLPPLVIPIDVPAWSFDIDANTYGPIWGGGMTLGSSYRWLVASIDANYQRSELKSSLGLIEGELEVMTVSPRLGARLPAWKTYGRGELWVGGMYMETTQTLRGMLPLREVAPDLAGLVGDFIAYELESETSENWATLLGGRWTLNERLDLMLEVGAGDRTQVMGAVTARF